MVQNKEHQEAGDNKDQQDKVTSQETSTESQPSTKDNNPDKVEQPEKKEVQPKEADKKETVVKESESNDEVKKVEHKADATSEEKDDDSDKQKVSEEKEAQKKDPELKDESDLNEHEGEDDDHDDEDDDVDYSEYSKEQLVEVIKELAKKDNIVQAEKKARQIKPFYDEIFEHEKEQALQKFKAEGGDEGDFDYQPDELDNRFEANYKLLRDKKYAYKKDQEERKENNLKAKEEFLERLREFVDADDPNFSFDKFKEMQAEWKSIGPVPPNYAKQLWANYNALIDRFYDHRSIYFELKELDRKKNLEAKLELCERAEGLATQENLKEAIKELNELHHDYKHIGPVPKEDQEPTWQRFKAASDAVYARRKEYVENLKEDLAKNEKVKRELGDKVQEFAEFDSDRIKKWNAKTKEILEIQKQWEATGGLPRATAKEVNKRFWNSFKKFFQNKSAFFKKLDAQREENLKKKQELVAKANELKDSTDWKSTADKLKATQRQWKEIGPVPEKYRESVYQEFKAACDHFFDQLRANTNDREKEYKENLEHKEAILDEIEKLAEAGEQDAEKLKELQGKYDELGFVPKRDVGRIKDRYTEVVDKFIKQLKGVKEEDKKKLKLESQIVKMKQGPNADHKLYKKEQSIRKQISNIENEIVNYKTNMEFFASSKTADKLKEDFKTKIDEANDQLKNLKQQLKIIRNA